MAKTVERNTLEYFLQYPQEVLQGLKNSQSPEIITREGEPVCVMMDMEVCRKIQQRIDFLEACEGIRKGLMMPKQAECSLWRNLTGNSEPNITFLQNERIHREPDQYGKNC